MALPVLFVLVTYDTQIKAKITWIIPKRLKQISFDQLLDFDFVLDLHGVRIYNVIQFRAK